jgi:hypothetical protein
MCKRIPACDFAVIPDVIDGDEAANDALLSEWPLPKWFGAPVWHLHESLDRLERLAAAYPRVCFGSSGEFASIGTAAWWGRMAQAMRVVCNDDGEPLCKLHGLRMLNPEVFTRFPFSSADSTNIGRNIGIDQTWRGNYMPPNKEVRAQVMRARIEAHEQPDALGAHVIPVEEIVAVVESIEAGERLYQEEIADRLAAALPGRQVLFGHHHGVDIETHRDGQVAQPSDSAPSPHREPSSSRARPHEQGNQP